MGELGFIQKLKNAGKSGGWQAFGQLVVGSGSTGANVHGQADFPVAGYYTVEFGVQTPTNGQYDCVAEVVWSVEGNDVRRLISVGSGTTISGTGAGVKVKLYDKSGSSFAAFFGQAYQASFLISPGTRPSEQKPPTLTAETSTGLARFVVTPGTTTIIDIPTDAGVTSVNVTVVASPLTAITETDAVVHIASSVPVKSFFPSDPDAWIAVPPNAKSIQLVNNFPALGPDLHFYVTYGIEG